MEIECSIPPHTYLSPAPVPPSWISWRQHTVCGWCPPSGFQSPPQTVLPQSHDQIQHAPCNRQIVIHDFLLYRSSTYNVPSLISDCRCYVAGIHSPRKQQPTFEVCWPTTTLPPNELTRIHWDYSGMECWYLWKRSWLIWKGCEERSSNRTDYLVPNGCKLHGGLTHPNEVLVL